MKNIDDKWRLIAIDGVAASGKSTTAKKLAGELGYQYLDTGAMYRAVALNLIDNGIGKDDNYAVISSLETVDIKVECKDDQMNIYLGDEEVSEKIRANEVSNLTSQISAIPEVRRMMVELQRALVKSNDFIVEGRDIGTVVFPDADMKFFLTASVEERAKRRFAELKEDGSNKTLEEIENEIEERDLRDSTRTTSPLVRAEDAIRVDTTDMTVDEQVKHLTRLIHTEMRKESQVYAGE
ncbi:(d)CMP kinase [Candidatus Marinimicrobia bacterium MT.SAG.3]|nr:(d)CMP kinase [Candidatus Marinimicrobia bacterium MT.SAG.3]